MIHTIPSVRRFLQDRGFDPLSADRSVSPEAAVLRCLEEAFTVPASFSGGGKEYVSVLEDCLSAMDERLYHEYRPMADLFRRFMLEAAPSADPGDSAWQRTLAFGARLGLVDPDMLLCRPHRNQTGGPEA